MRAKLQPLKSNALIVVDKNISIVTGTENNWSQYINIREKILLEQEQGQADIGAKISNLRIYGQCSNYHFFLVVGDNKEIIGYGRLISGLLKENRHLAKVKLGFLRDFNLPQVKKKLLEEIESYALKHNIKRLEQTVFQTHFNDVQLNIDLGYKIEGKLSRTNIIEGEFVDSYLMAKVS